jgi:hypothetical protein
MAMKKKAPKKAASPRSSNDLAGRYGFGNDLLPSGKSGSGFVGDYYGLIGRTTQRGKDIEKRTVAKKTARGNTAQSARMTAQAKAAKKKK